ncbi:SPOR domain-containing protein [bacterium]|nr:SPOR domain-containing protein [bacterium]
MRLSLGFSQAVVLLGVILGGFGVSYVLGLRSGQVHRFNEYASQALERMPRLAVDEEQEPEQVSNELVAEVYAKLQDNTPERALFDDEPARGDKRARQGEKPRDAEEIAPVRIVPLSEERSTNAANKKVLGDLQGGASDGAKSGDGALQRQPSAKTVKEEVKPSKASRNAGSGATLGGLFELTNEQKPEAEEGKKGVTLTPPLQPRRKEVAAPVAPNAPSGSATLPRGWYVQLAALENEAEALRLLQQLHKNGFLEAKIQTARVRGTTYHRVLVGPEKNTVFAKRLRDQLAREPYVAFKPYLKNIR